MSDRDKKRAFGIAAGAAVAAASAVGAVAMFGRGDKTDTSPPAIEFSDEETSGRGQPSRGPDPASRESGYDLMDASVASLVKIIALAVTTLVVSVAAVFFMFSRFDRAFQEPNKDLTAQQRAPVPPPLPHLQAVPYNDIDAVLMEQTRRLTTYGWDSSAHKGAHIPIERAIQQVIGKPLDQSAQADAVGPKSSDAPQPATPAFNADIQQAKPANRVQGEGNLDAVAPTFKMEPLPEAKP